ncbi:MAG: hypothetical protein ABIH71_07285 [Candidatus Omnitrophota bacterium]|nr:hypothetical protein [Candidatus Omnitrophota bacterium]
MKKKGIAKLVSNIAKVFTKKKCESKSSEGKYKCNICGRMISERKALIHVKAEEYIMNLIKKDHPQWNSDDPSCHVCIDYYRKLVKDGKI